MPDETTASGAPQSAAEQFARGGAVMVLIFGLISQSSWGSLVLLGVLAAVVALAVILQPRFMPSAPLPGTRGSLLAAAGGLAGVAAILETISEFGWILGHLTSLDTWVFALFVIGALGMAWGGWLILKAEGGRFRIGAPGGPASGSGSASGSGPAAGTPDQPA